MKYMLEGAETERLKFGLLTQAYFDEWTELFKEKKVATFLALDENLSPKELCQIWFDKVYYRYENDLGGMNVLIDKSTNQLIGQCGLLIQTIDSEERLEIGFSILPQYRNMGYASEAAIKCKAYAFENNLTESLISIVHVDNKASEKVALKNGMQLEKTLVNHRGNRENIFSIRKTDWE